MAIETMFDRIFPKLIFTEFFGLLSKRIEFTLNALITKSLKVFEMNSIQVFKKIVITKEVLSYEK